MRQSRTSRVPRVEAQYVVGWFLIIILLGLSARAFAEEAPESVEVSDPEPSRDAATAFGPAELQPRSGYETVPQIGGPTSAGVALIRADLEKQPTLPLPAFSDRVIPRWFGFKEKLFQDYGLAFGASYNLMAQTYRDADPDSAVGGIFDASLSWTLFGHRKERSGTLVMLVENQHRLGTRFAPQEAGLLAGAAAPTASFSDTPWQLNNLYWNQRLAGDRLILVAGLVDASDYVDYHALNDPLTAFASYAFSGTPTIPLPSPGTGVKIRGAMANGLYLSAGVADGKAQPGSVDVNGLFSDPALFTHLEIGATPSFRQRFIDNTHLTLWHQAAHEESGIPEDWGAALTLSTRRTQRITAFARVALSRGRSTLLEQSFSIGAAYSLRSFDRIGAAVNWGKVTESSEEQVTFETFYRFQFGPLTTLTPSVQVVLNPGLNPERSYLIVLGMRARVAF